MVSLICLWGGEGPVMVALAEPVEGCVEKAGPG